MPLLYFAIALLLHGIYAITETQLREYHIVTLARKALKLIIDHLQNFDSTKTC
jgi:uncharacterized membrane protein (Fun14 family)